MKTLCLLLVLCFSLNSLAQTGSDVILKNAMDEYHYSVTVEWDQKDDTVFRKATEKFFDGIHQAVAEGLTVEEINHLTEKTIQNKHALDQIKKELAAVTDIHDQSAILDILKNHSQSFYQRGSSWNAEAGAIIWWTVGSAAVIGLIAFTVWFYSNHECVQTGQEWQCSETTNGNTTNSTCKWVTVCTRWAPKN